MNKEDKHISSANESNLIYRQKQSMEISNGVKLFIGMIASSQKLIEDTIPLLEDKWGNIGLKSECVDFAYTDYYRKEMGSGLWRQWIAFEKLISPDELAKIKVQTNSIEEKFSESGKRKINLDPGYLALSKLVLASTKDFSHRIYLSDGIYAEITMLFKGKQFQNLPWTYPDYSSDFGKNYFMKLREKYRQQF